MQYLRSLKLKSKGNKGVSLILVLFIIAAFWAISMVITRFTAQELKFAEVNEYSEIAYYAADAGVERGMYCARKSNPTSQCTIDKDSSNCDSCGNVDADRNPLSNGAFYTVVITPSGGKRPDWAGGETCDAGNYCIDSKGEYTGATPNVVRIKSREY